MSAGRLEYAVFERPFAQHFRYGSRVLTHRTGVLLRRGDLVSEASPLPGHSTDTLAEVLEALAAGDFANAPPSLRFALEGLDAIASPGTHPVRSNALLAAADLAESRRRLRELAGEGYLTVKLKIGPGALSDLPALLENGQGITFRLDANQSLDPSSLGALAAGLERRGLLPRVEYLEEPFAGVWDDGSMRGLPLALAADESASLALLETANPPAVFILKPTVAGGLISLDGMLSRLRFAGKKTVFTSTMESEPGRRSLLAFLAREPRETCGLSTGSLFAENFLADRPLWTEVPAPTNAERRFHASLSWKESR